MEAPECARVRQCRAWRRKLQSPCGALARSAIFVPHPRQGGPVTKQDLVDAVAKRLGVTKARAGEITELFFSESGLIAAELRRGGRVTVSGFGTFEIRRRAAREGRNPRTGKALSI